jgi:hypothetical protein
MLRRRPNELGGQDGETLWEVQASGTQAQPQAVGSQL